jgi:hypothetical protein
MFLLIRLFFAAMLFVVLAVVGNSVLFPVACGVLWLGYKLFCFMSRMADGEENRRYRRAVIDQVLGPRE